MQVWKTLISVPNPLDFGSEAGTCLGKYLNKAFHNIQPSGQWSSLLRNRKQTMLKVSKNRPQKMTNMLGAITPNVY